MSDFDKNLRRPKIKILNINSMSVTGTKQKLFLDEMNEAEDQTLVRHILMSLTFSFRT